MATLCGALFGAELQALKRSRLSKKVSRIKLFVARLSLLRQMEEVANQLKTDFSTANAVLSKIAISKLSAASTGLPTPTRRGS